MKRGTLFRLIALCLCGGCATVVNTPQVSLPSFLNTRPKEGAYCLDTAWVGSTGRTLRTGSFVTTDNSSQGEYVRNLRFTRVHAYKSGGIYLVQEKTKGPFFPFKSTYWIEDFQYASTLPSPQIIAECASLSDLRALLDQGVDYGGSAMLLQDGSGRHHSNEQWSLFTLRGQDTIELMQVWAAYSQQFDAAGTIYPKHVTGVLIRSEIVKAEETKKHNQPSDHTR